jgi:hypothetical protein
VSEQRHAVHPVRAVDGQVAIEPPAAAGGEVAAQDPAPRSAGRIQAVVLRQILDPRGTPLAAR